MPEPFRPAALAPLACLLALAAPAQANDSMAETALGGLTLTRTDAIRMDSEDLYISRDLVRVKYSFTNITDAPVETDVAFPLPDIPPAEEDGPRYWDDARRDLAFKTTIDGKPTPLVIRETALFAGKDIGARLGAAGIPVRRFAEDFSDRINALPKATRDALVAEGLIRDDGIGKTQLWAGMWTLKTHVLRRQTFPPKTRVTVEHEYKPLVGGAVGGYLDPEMRKGEEAKWFAQKRRKFCIDDDWMKSFDARRRRGPQGANYSETWIGYVLKTGANWAGPIGDFRLVVDKGKPESLVSFCGEGVTKISPTQFEIRKTGFTPKNDLDVLIVDWRAD